MDVQLTDAAGVDCRSPVAVGADAVERPGEDPGGGGLADTANAGENKRMGNAPGRERVGQGADHRLLADQIGKIVAAGICAPEPDSRRVLFNLQSALLGRKRRVPASVSSSSGHARRRS